MKNNKLRRRSITFDDVTHQRCRVLANDMALSTSAFLRVLIKETYDKFKNQEQGRASSSVTGTGIDLHRLSNPAP